MTPKHVFDIAEFTLSALVKYFVSCREKKGKYKLWVIIVDSVLAVFIFHVNSDFTKFFWLVLLQQSCEISRNFCFNKKKFTTYSLFLQQFFFSNETTFVLIKRLLLTYMTFQMHFCVSV